MLHASGRSRCGNKHKLAGMEDTDSDLQATAMDASAEATPSRSMVISEGEIKRLREDLRGLSNSIGNLEKQLGELSTPLVELSQKEDAGITAKCWMKQVRELCYDTRDSLHELMRSDALFGILEARAENASETLEWYGIRPKTPSVSMVRRLPAPPQAHLIDEDYKPLVGEVHSLMGTNKNLKVVSIVGPEGVGKTTLAKRLYQSVGPSGTVYCRAFLRASPKPDIMKLLTSMFIQIQRKQPSCCLSAQDLINSIAGYLQNKRYFIIIDDLWTDDVWGIISRAFPNGTCCSRIITTTQIMDVALACCGNQPTYVLNMTPLTDVQSHTLFFQTVFGYGNACPGDLVEVSDGIISKCGGIPLATINIASMLPNTLMLVEWTEIRQSLPSAWSTNPSSWMKEVANLMFSTLRPHLKTSLLYFSMYPVGWIVRKDDLVKQWLVEGFLDGVRGQQTEEIAGGYFDELVRRGMIQPVDTNINGLVLSCTLHKTIHDVIVNKSMEENFVTIVDYFQSYIALPDKVRRLSVQFGGARSAYVPESIMVSKLRSVAFFGLFKCLPSNIVKYSFLGVLILHIWADEDKHIFDLTGIRELLRLRYLKIACNTAVKLPDEIQMQQILETLEVDATLANIPSDIGELRKLRILKIAVTKLSNKDIYSLQILPALSALSVHVKTSPSKLFFFRKGGFSVLKFFTFRCSAPRLVIKENAMPNVEKVNLCFRAREGRQDGKKPITIRHLPNLKEISAKIWGAMAEAGSAFENAVSNDARNPTPIVQLMESTEDKEHATLEEQDEIIEEWCADVSGKDELSEADPARTRPLLQQPLFSQTTPLGASNSRSLLPPLPPVSGVASGVQMEVALGTARSLFGKVFTKLSDRLVAAYVDSLELGHNLEHIKAKVLHTEGLLYKAEKRYIGFNSGLRSLLPALRKNAEEAEDLLDEIQYFQIHDRLHGTNYAATNCSTTDGDELHFDRVSVSRKLKLVLQDMQTNCDMVSTLPGLILTEATTLRVRPSVAVHQPQIGSIIIQDTLYGRRDTFEETVNRVTGGTQTVSVLPIVGPGGIGKTTFTQHLYNNSRIERHFDVRIWVCVWTDFDVLKLSREIFGCILATEGEVSSSFANGATNLDELQLCIVHHLKSKRFLIVLDDIWKCDGEYQWKTLLAPFTKGETKGSVVLVTTRFPKVAGMVKTVDPLELRGLESNDFFTFFEACIFGDHKPPPYKDEFVGIARKIANKLKGSPLAAKTVGILLHKDLSCKHWNGVLQKHEWLKQKNDDDIMPFLEISYDYLPSDVKKCFSYFGLFPKDHRFTNSEMNSLFVAIDIEVDRNYLEQLVDNGFLMKGDDSGYEYYILHDLMHELCQSVSTEECLNISDLDFRADVIPQSVRHLSITIENIYNENFEEEMCKLMGRIDIANLRTLMIFRKYGERIVKLLKDCFKEINSLRVLFIVHYSPEPFTYRFSKLIHLQYLKISSYIYNRRSLPSALSRFYHLKFLDLDEWLGSSDLPEDFSHLENLHDFRAKKELHSNIRNVGKIKHLRRLKEFHVKKENKGFELRELGELTNLEEELIIHGLEHVENKEEATAAKLMLKLNLKELKLLWSGDRRTIDVDILDGLQPQPLLKVLTIANHGGNSGPSWLYLDPYLDMCLICLETLTLEGVYWSTLPPLGKLPSLQVLTMKRNSGIRQFGPGCGGIPGTCFIRLKRIEFHEMPELEEWVEEPNCHSFPNLEIIKCFDCPKLRVMPFSEVSCTNLCTFEVKKCPRMSLPSMPHTSTVTDLVVKRTSSEMLIYYQKKLFVSGYRSALAFHNLDKVQNMKIRDVSHISLTHIEKLEVLKELDIARCGGLIPEELDVNIVLRSVKSLRLDVSHLSTKSTSEVLNCFPALSVLNIDQFSHYAKLVMQFPSHSSLQELSFSYCESLVLLPVENGGGIEEVNSSLQSLTILQCGKLFCQWPMGEAGGGAQIIYPFPASLRKLYVHNEPSMKSMALLSNLTSLTSLNLYMCSNLTMDGFNPIIAVNLKELSVLECNIVAADLLSEVVRTNLLPAGYISRLEELTVDDICGWLVAPICNLLASALHTLKIYKDKRAKSFTEEQEKALQLLSSLQILEFSECEGLQSLPQGLHHLSSLKELSVYGPTKIRSVPEEGFPVSLRKLRLGCSVEMVKQIEKIKRTNPDLTVTEY